MIDQFELSETIYKETLTHYGATYSLDGKAPTTGYMVGGFGPEVTVKVEDFNIGDVASYIAWNKPALSEPGRYLGTWISDGLVYLDVSENFASVTKALDAAQGKAQLAIWSVSLGAEIKL